MDPSHGIKNLSFQIAGYHPTIRTRYTYCDGGLRYFAFLGANLRRYGLLRQTYPGTTRESFCPQPEE